MKKLVSLVALAAATTFAAAIPATSAFATGYTCYTDTTSRVTQHAPVGTPWTVGSATQRPLDTCTNLSDWGDNVYHLKHTGTTYLSLSADGATHTKNQLAGAIGNPVPGDDIFVQIGSGSSWVDIAEYDSTGAQDLWDSLYGLCGGSPCP